jgi:hypothetical protein
VDSKTYRIGDERAGPWAAWLIVSASLFIKADDGFGGARHGLAHHRDRRGYVVAGLSLGLVEPSLRRLPRRTRRVARR